MYRDPLTGPILFLNAEQLLVVAGYFTRICYITWYQIPRITQSTLLPGRPVQLNTILTSLESIQPCYNYHAKIIHAPLF